MLLSAFALLAALHTAPATDSVAGTWQIKGDVMGNPINELCTITQTGATLSGSCDVQGDKAWPISGEVSDTAIVFRHYGEYNGDQLTMTFTAKRVSPTQLKGKLVVQPFGVDGDFTATPATPAAAGTTGAAAATTTSAAPASAPSTRPAAPTKP